MRGVRHTQNKVVITSSFYINRSTEHKNSLQVDKIIAKMDTKQFEIIYTQKYTVFVNSSQTGLLSRWVYTTPLVSCEFLKRTLSRVLH